MEVLKNPELLQKGDEEVWRALLDGQGVVKDFISPEIAKAFGDKLDTIIQEEDTVGIVLNSTQETWDNDIYQLSPEDKVLLKSLEQLFAAIIARAADLDEDKVIAGISEVLKYVHKGQEWHTDNYEVSDAQPGYLANLAVINGILTLKGRAKYYYKDPVTGNVEEIETSPGTLVLTRSGDVDGLPQIEHAVDPPKKSDAGEAENRIVILFSAPEAKT